MATASPLTPAGAASTAAEPHEQVEPYVPASASLPELTPLPLLLGTLLGMVFGASSLYLVLKVGLTVSASIPVAVTTAPGTGTPGCARSSPGSGSRPNITSST